MLDTRSKLGATGPVPAGGTITLQITGRAGIPLGGAAAVMLNLTVTTPTGSGYITAYPSGTTRPQVSNLNFVRGSTVPNLVLVRLGSDGKVRLFNGSDGTVQLVGDVSGYVLAGTPTAAGTFVSLPPARVLDTRIKMGATGPLARSTPIAVQIAGLAGVPAGRARAVILNVTVLAPKSGVSDGYLTAYPSGNAPNASNLNFLPGQTVANLVTVPIGADGRIRLQGVFGGTAGVGIDAIADVAGYTLAGPSTTAGALYPLSPVRILDTRAGLSVGAVGPVVRGGSVGLKVAGVGGVVPSGASSVVLNVTVVDNGYDPRGGGYITVHPSGATRPVASNLNFVRGQTAANSVVVPLGADGKIVLYNGSGGSVQLLADVAGYTLAAPLHRSVWAWGTNHCGALGDGLGYCNSNASGTPVRAGVLTDVVSTAGGESNGYALKSDGTVWAWGSNDVGELGNGTRTNSNTPVRVSGLSGVKAVVATRNSTALAVKNDGTVWAWGYNSSGLLGSSTAAQFSTLPVRVLGLSSVTSLAAGGSTAYAVKSDGTLWAWGYGGGGTLGDGVTFTISTATPVRVSGLTGVTAAAGGLENGYAVTSDGTVWSWGYNNDGELGTGDRVYTTVPVKVVSLAGATAIAAGPRTAYARKSDGTVWSWGQNNSGELGSGSSAINSLSPVRVSGLTDVSAIAAGYALTSNGKVWAWGNNNDGRLGNGTVGPLGGSFNNTPTPVVQMSGAVALSSGVQTGYVIVN